MGNKPDRSRKMQQPYNQMVEDAIAALKDRPGSTQADIFNYLEAKYEGKISPKNKHNLQTVIRSVIQTKKRRLRYGPTPGRKPGGRRRLKAKAGQGKFGRGAPRGRVRGIMGRPPGNNNNKNNKSFQKPKAPGLQKSQGRSPRLPANLKPKAPGLPTAPASGRSKAPEHVLRRAKRGTGRGSKLLPRPARITTSEGSITSDEMTA